MFKFFRDFFKTKIGLAISLAFLGLIALAFASMDVSSTGTFGGIAGGDRVAVVGDEKIGTADLVQAANNGLDRVREEQPTLTMQTFLAQGGMTQVLNALVDRFALRGYAEDFGLRAGDNLVNSEIRSIPAFRGANGSFSEDVYRQALAQGRFTDAQVREDLGTGLLSQQLFIPASFGATVPEKLAYRYAQLFKERRQGSIALLPAASFAPTGDVSAETLRSYYESNRTDFVRPERRVIRYATFGSDALGDRIEPTDTEIAARYRQNATQYRASETRDFTQFIVPTQAAANSFRDRALAGVSLEQLAEEAGLRAAPVVDATREGLASQASEDVAEAVFAASEGSVAQPARSSLGWHIVRVDDVQTNAARSLAEVQSEIATTLRDEKRVRGLSDLAITIEEQLADGATLAEVAEEFSLETTNTRPVLADGRLYQQANQTVTDVLAPALATAFQMDEGEPEIAALEGADTYLLYEVADITRSSVAPLAEIEATVEERWRLAQGLRRAEASAGRVMKRVRNGESVAAALSAEDIQLPSPENVNLTREQLAQQREQRIPPPLALLFSMAEGTTKKLEASGGLGFFVVDLQSVAVEDIADDDPLIAQAKNQMGQLLGEEYGEQLRIAIRDELGVERNPEAIEAVRRQLAGEN